MRFVEYVLKYSNTRRSNFTSIYACNNIYNTLESIQSDCNEKVVEMNIMFN